MQRGVDFLVADFFDERNLYSTPSLANEAQAPAPEQTLTPFDIVYLAPPWGGCVCVFVATPNLDKTFHLRLVPSKDSPVVVATMALAYLFG